MRKTADRDWTESARSPAVGRPRRRKPQWSATPQGTVVRDDARRYRREL